MFEARRLVVLSAGGMRGFGTAPFRFAAADGSFGLRDLTPVVEGRQMRCVWRRVNGSKSPSKKGLREWKDTDPPCNSGRLFSKCVGYARVCGRAGNSSDIAKVENSRRRG